ncbi:hypothetical protein XF24_00018 [candidate division SR1 bacterium Aalborg_AAW-1]|nr:hypothetical protein XF24_00018 [candidate division SR1 bacterium Aalborg_AAW-1]
MLTTLKNFGHKLLGLYLIAGSALVATANTAFAQTQGGTTLPFADPDKSAGINVGGAGSDQGDTIIDIIKRFINYALGFLALIALVMLLWGGYKMVASGGDEGAYKEGLKILKNAAIGIAFIAVSWFLVTFIFYVIGFVVGS